MKLKFILLVFIILCVGFMGVVYADEKISDAKNDPKITPAQLSEINCVLSSFDTYYDENINPGRVENVILSSRNTNKTLLLPGEEFSFNEIVGPREIETGFREATTFENGKVTSDVGGGICQTSTTIFNAVLLAGLEITERHNHSLKVDYIPIGRDAMVKWGYSDFKFRNNTDYPIIVFVSGKGGKVHTEIWGNSSAKKKIELTQFVSDDNYQASLLRYEIDSKGNKKLTYSTKSKYLVPQD